MECVYLSFLWISPEVVGSVLWSQACECVTKSLFHLSKGLLLCGNAQVICVHETHCVGVKDAALWKAIFLSAPSAAFSDEVHKKHMCDSMFWISSVIICLIACSGSVL